MWYLDRFSDAAGSEVTDLDAIFNRTANLGTEAVPSPLIATVSGGHDPIGTYQRIRQSVRHINAEGELYGSDLSTEIAALNGDIGKRRRLYRVMEDGTEQWCDARLLNVNINRQWPKTNVLPVRLEYQAIGPWNGVEHTVNETYTDGDGYEKTISGNLRQYDVDLRLTPISTNMTYLHIQNYASGIDIEFNGTVNAGQVLKIDSGEISVTNHGSDAYDDLSFGSGHTLDGLFAMNDGANVFDIDFTGPATATLTMNFYEAWA